MPTERFENLATPRIARILSVALDEFANHSYHNASYNRIIKGSGLSKGTMYYYFRSKEDLFQTLIKACSRDFQGLLNPGAGPDSATDYWLQLEAMLNQFLQLLRKKPILARLISQFLSRDSRRSQHPAAVTLTQIDEWLQEYVVTGQLLGAVRTDLAVEFLSQLVWSVWDSASLWFDITNTSAPHSQVCEVVLDLLKRVLMPSHSQSANDGKIPEQRL